MKVPKISIPKMNMASVKQAATNAFAASKNFVKAAPGKIGTLAQDTLELAKANKKQAGVIAGAAVAGAGALVGAGELVEAGVDKVKAKRYE